MRGHEGDIKGFIQLSRAYYGEANLKARRDIEDKISFGLYSPDGGTSGELIVEWVPLSGKYVPKFHVYSDGWSALSQFHDLINVMGDHDDEDPTPEEFCQYLLQCGFKDMTEEENPYEKRNNEL